MGDNKFLEDYRYIKENNSGTGKYLIKKYNEYNSTDLLCPLLDNIEKIINIWDVCILDSLDYTIEDIDELFKQGPVMKNLDIQFFIITRIYICTHQWKSKSQILNVMLPSLGLYQFP